MGVLGFAFLNAGSRAFRDSIFIFILKLVYNNRSGPNRSEGRIFTLSLSPTEWNSPDLMSLAGVESTRIPTPLTPHLQCKNPFLTLLDLHLRCLERGTEGAVCPLCRMYRELLFVINYVLRPVASSVVCGLGRSVCVCVEKETEHNFAGKRSCTFETITMAPIQAKVSMLKLSIRATSDLVYGIFGL